MLVCKIPVESYDKKNPRKTFSKEQTPNQRRLKPKKGAPPLAK